jgi:hypothetical protein
MKKNSIDCLLKKKKEEEFALNLLRRMLGDEHVFTPFMAKKGEGNLQN